MAISPEQICSLQPILMRSPGPTRRQFWTKWMLVVSLLTSSYLLYTRQPSHKSSPPAQEVRYERFHEKNTPELADAMLAFQFRLRR